MVHNSEMSRGAEADHGKHTFAPKRASALTSVTRQVNI